MDTNKVRYLSNIMQRSANNYNMQMDSLKSSVEGVDSQAQAKNEFVMKFDILVSANKQSTQALETMAQALDDKANQWEAIAQVFNGSYQNLKGLLNLALGFLSNTWSSVIDSMANINFPSIPLPSISIGSIVGGIVGGWPDRKYSHISI